MLFLTPSNWSAVVGGLASLRPSGRLIGGILVGAVAGYAAIRGYAQVLIISTIGLGFFIVVLRYPFYGLLAWLILSPAVSAKFRLSLPAGLPDLTFSRMAVMSFVVALGLQAMVGERKLMRAGSVEGTMVVMTVICVLDIITRSDNVGSSGLIYFDEYITPFLLFFVAKNVVTTTEELRKLCLALTVLGVYLAIHGCYQYLTHSDLGGIQLQDAAVVHHLSEGRARGPLENAVQYGGVLGIALIWSLFLMSSGRPSSLPTFAVLIIGAGILFSLTRAVWLGLFFAVVFIGVAQPRLRRPIFASLSVLVAVILMIWVFSLSPGSRIQERVISSEPIYIRLVMYGAAVSMFAANPIVGYGSGDETFILGREEHLRSIGSINAEWGNLAGPPHNIYLYVGVQWGLLGLIPYLAIFGLLLKHGRDLHRSVSDIDDPCRWVHALFGATLILYLTMGFFDDISGFPAFTSLFFVMAGALDGFYERNTRAEVVKTAVRPFP